MVQNGDKRLGRHTKRHTHLTRVRSSQDDGPQWLTKPTTGKRKCGKSEGRPYRRADDPLHTRTRNPNMSPESTHRLMATVQAAKTKRWVLDRAKRAGVSNPRSIFGDAPTVGSLCAEAGVVMNVKTHKLQRQAKTGNKYDLWTNVRAVWADYEVTKLERAWQNRELALRQAIATKGGNEWNIPHVEPVVRTKLLRKCRL